MPDVDACPYCGKTPLHPQAVTCGRCNRKIPQGALSLEKVGSRYVLGVLEDSYGIWHYSAGGEPAAHFAKTEEGWRRAWTSFQQWENPADAPGPSGGGGTNGYAVAGLILGVIGAAVGLIPILAWLALICGILGIVFGSMGIRRARATGGRGIAIAGLVLGILAVVLAIIGFVIVEETFRELEEIFESPL